MSDPIAQADTADWWFNVCTNTALRAQRLQRERDEARATIAGLRELHRPMPSDGPTATRCASCVAGYDPATRDLLYCAYPCQTMRIIGLEPA